MIIYLSFLLAYVAVGIFLVVLIRRVVTGHPRRTSWTILFIAAYILIPFGDHMAGSLYLKYLCNTQAEQRVVKTAENVPGFLAKGRAIEPSKFDPYQFVEQEKEDGRISRLTVTADGKIAREDGVPSISRYRYRQGPVPVGLWTVRYERVIEDMKTGEVLAQETRFNFRGGWLLHAMFKTYGTTQSCEGLPKLQGMIPQVLKPAPSAFWK